MRIWDIDSSQLCRKHLVAQWREGLGLYNIIRDNKQGYKNHPETIRSRKNGLYWLWNKLRQTKNEAEKRGYNFKELPEKPKLNLPEQETKWQSIEEQTEILRQKGCECEV